MGVKQLVTAGKAINRVFVGNLPWTVGNRELKQYFSKYGLVSQAQVVFDRKSGHSKRYGFVHFAKNESVKTVSDTNEHKLEGNILTVQPAAV